MPLALVTGGTGFIGSHVVRRLLREGVSVRCLARPQSNRKNLAGLPVEIIEGDLGSPVSLAPAVKGCDLLFHVAADYRLWVKDPAEMRRINVEGSRALLQAAMSAGVSKIVYTSSVAAVGRPRRNGEVGTLQHYRSFSECFRGPSSPRMPRCARTIYASAPGRTVHRAGRERYEKHRGASRQSGERW